MRGAYLFVLVVCAEEGLRSDIPVISLAGPNGRSKGGSAAK